MASTNRFSLLPVLLLLPLLSSAATPPPCSPPARSPPPPPPPSPPPPPPPSSSAVPWTEMTASYYGGPTADGANNGACGYGNANQNGYGVTTASASGQLYGNGAACGSCYEVQCVPSKSKFCLPSTPTINITVTNLCPTGYEGLCDFPKLHLSLTQPMFSTIGQIVGGVIPIRARRIACVKKGGIAFTIMWGSYDSFLLVLVSNVGAGGDVAAVDVKFDSGAWEAMYRNYGSVWSVSGGRYLNKAMSFRVRLFKAGTEVTANSVVPKTWTFGGKYVSTVDF